MFKLAVCAAAAAAALVAVPASAATTITYNTGQTIVLAPNGPGEVAASFGFTVSGSGDFTAVLDFVNPFDPAQAGGSAVFNFDGDIITFTGADISGGGVATISTDALGTSIKVDRFALGGGNQTLTFTGSLNPGGNGFAQIGGQLALAQVPEPATWALFILGFGAVGHTLRRRNAKVRVGKASLHFA